MKKIIFISIICLIAMNIFTQSPPGDDNNNELDNTEENKDSIYIDEETENEENLFYDDIDILIDEDLNTEEIPGEYYEDIENILPDNENIIEEKESIDEKKEEIDNTEYDYKETPEDIEEITEKSFEPTTILSTYIGLERLNFGSSKDELEYIFGSPSKEYQIDGVKVYAYSENKTDYLTFYFINNQLVSIEIENEYNNIMGEKLILDEEITFQSTISDIVAKYGKLKVFGNDLMGYTLYSPIKGLFITLSKHLEIKKITLNSYYDKEARKLETMHKEELKEEVNDFYTIIENVMRIDENVFKGIPEEAKFFIDISYFDDIENFEIREEIKSID